MRIIQLVSLLVFLVALFIGHQITRPLKIPEDRVFTFKPGQNATDLARMLQEDGIFRYSPLVLLTAKLGNFERKLKAGEFRFESDFNLLAVLAHIVEGKSIVYPVRFIEGWTFKDYLSELRSKTNLEHTLANVEIEDILDVLQIPKKHPEGWFYPDTYIFNSGQSDAKILQTAYDAMHTALEREWNQSRPDLPYKTAYEGLIVASIIQKESSAVSEYPVIAGVIVNRLRKGMRLQMDPTVIYGLGGLDSPIRKSHLDKDTPYNTYTRHGLPPTPISMPGLEALKAAARPAETSALYFVSRGDGTHKFSDTLDEHLVAVREYRRTFKQ